MSLALIRLLQLASPALPVGAYSYSQGLESAVEAGIVKGAAAAKAWIGDLLHFNVATMEAPLGVRLYRAWRDDDNEAASYWNSYALASRETMELRAESAQMGYSLTRLLVDGNFCDVTKLASLTQLESKSFPAAFGFAAFEFGLSENEFVSAYLWSWLENQVIAAVKLVPLGQVAGQKLMFALGGAIPQLAEQILNLSDDDLCNYAPGLAILSSQHETQYSRLFRS